MTPAPIASPFKSFAQFMKVVRLIHGGLCASLVLLLVVMWIATSNLPPMTAEQAGRINAQALLIAACVVSVACVGVAAFLPQLALRAVDKRDLALRMRAVLHARILFAAAFEGGGILWAVLGLLLRDPRYFAGGAGALLVLVAFFPRSADLESMIGHDEAVIDRALKKAVAP
jgi:hypothetical protein